jgi:hypothetical protein
MTPRDPVDLIAGYVKTNLKGEVFAPAPGWSHMGAVICDAVLQRRLRYETVVRPRIIKLRVVWPNADTVSRFRDHIARHDLQAVIDVNSPIRIKTIRDLTERLVVAGVETREQLNTWLDDSTHGLDLQRVKWVGPKTGAYLGILVGRSQVAIDTRLRRFAADAGVHEPDTRLVEYFTQAAAQLGCDPAGLDHAIWKHMGPETYTFPTLTACETHVKIGASTFDAAPARLGVLERIPSTVAAQRPQIIDGP